MHVLSYIEHAQFLVYATAELYIIYFLVGIYDESHTAVRQIMDSQMTATTSQSTSPSKRLI